MTQKELPPLTIWEYQLKQADTLVDLIVEANLQGGEGWELFDIISGGTFYVGAFKRKKG